MPGHMSTWNSCFEEEPGRGRIRFHIYSNYPINIFRSIHHRGREDNRYWKKKKKFPRNNVGMFIRFEWVFRSREFSSLRSKTVCCVDCRLFDDRLLTPIAAYLGGGRPGQCSSPASRDDISSESFPGSEVRGFREGEGRRGQNWRRSRSDVNVRLGFSRGRRAASGRLSAFPTPRRKRWWMAHPVERVNHSVTIYTLPQR